MYVPSHRDTGVCTTNERRFQATAYGTTNAQSRGSGMLRRWPMAKQRLGQTQGRQPTRFASEIPQPRSLCFFTSKKKKSSLVLVWLKVIINCSMSGREKRGGHVANRVLAHVGADVPRLREISMLFIKFGLLFIRKIGTTSTTDNVAACKAHAAASVHPRTHVDICVARLRASRPHEHWFNSYERDCCTPSQHAQACARARWAAPIHQPAA